MSKKTRIGIIVALAIVFAGAVILNEARNAPDSSDEAARPAASAEESPSREGPEGRATAAIEEPLPRLVDLGSDKCIPCKMMAPILENLSKDYGDQFEVEVIDVRRNRSAGELYGIRVIPTQIFYDAEGVERFRHEGFLSKEEILKKWIELGVDVTPPPSGGQG